MKGQTYEKLWAQVDEAQKKSLPKTVVELTGQIYKKAEAEKNSPQMLKAYTARAMNQERIDPDIYYTNLKDLEQWALTSENPVERAVLNTLIAGIYADFAANNQRQMRQRTELTGDAPEDIREWSAGLFINKVLDHTRAALKDSTVLLATSSKDYRPFVKLGNTSEYYRHDMYHLLTIKATNALKQIAWLDKSGKANEAVSAIFENLTRTYKELNNQDAFILASLDRIRWEYDTNGEELLPAYDKLIAEHQSRGVVAEVYLQKTHTLLMSRQYEKALQIADEAIARYPNYERINAVKALRETILEPQLRIGTNGMAYPGEDFELNVSHRNLDSFVLEYYRVNLPVDSKLLQKYGDMSRLTQYLTKVSSQQINLVRPTNYLEVDTLLTLKAPAEGLYLVRVTSGASGKNRSDKLLSVTRLKLMTIKLPNEQMEAVVLDGMTGHPVKDARIRLFKSPKGVVTESRVLTTNAEGKAITACAFNEFQYVTVEKGSDKGMMLEYLRNGSYGVRDIPREGDGTPGVQLLTDRTLYRPGQTIYVKGIAYNFLPDTARVIAGKKHTLILYDSNRREISKQDVVTNEYGSFAAEFVLPVGGLNGMYELVAGTDNVFIRVEEYKRPTFDITFVPQEGTYRTGDSIQVKGSVRSYSGIAVQDVPVNYTVTRSLRQWWGGYLERESLISSGTVEVDSDGNFSIPATLLPDPNRKADEGFYTYTVEATVTNVAGETQTSQTRLSAGSRSLLLNVDMAEKVNREDTIRATFAATNLNGQPVEVKGTYKVYPFDNYKERKASTDPVLSGNFISNQETVMSSFKSLPSGAYKLVLSAKDPAGREATAEKEVILFSPNDTRPPMETDIWYHPLNLNFDEKNPAAFIFGTSHKDTYVLMDVFSGNKRLESKTFYITDSLMRFDYPYQQSYGNGLMVSFLFVKNGNAVTERIEIKKRIPDKELKMKWEVFRDKLQPGQKEEWRLTIVDPQGIPADAEMLATLYDASLDKIWGNNQTLRLNYHRSVPYAWWALYQSEPNFHNLGFNRKSWNYPSLVYDDFWTKLVKQNYNSYGVSTRARLAGSVAGLEVLQVVEDDAADEVMFESGIIDINSLPNMKPAAPKSGGGDDLGSLSEPPAELRTNFSETAFFYPQLRTNENGEIVISFTMPESLTRWNFNGYAHTKGMLTGMLKGEVVTSKEFMLAPNLPRFVRVGDKTSVGASVTNTTGNVISGYVTFTLFDPMTEKVISVQKEKFTADAGKSTAVNFSFTADDKYDMLGCRIIADGGKFRDGEQHLLPVLSNKERIIETVSMPVRGNETREFPLGTLFNNNSKTATDRQLTVEFSGNPAWYAVQALPSVSMPTNDNAVSWATAWYANSLAAYIMNAQPRIKTMFDTWKAQGGSKETFVSNLQKNQDVKSILLEESPWLMEAKTEADQMRRVATLFDLNNISNNNTSALNKLKELQLYDGSWSWYKGMSGSRYITTYILQTIIRLNLLTGQKPETDIAAMQKSAFNFLHQEALTEYKRMREAEKKGSKIKGVSGSILDYLYLIALSGERVPTTNSEAYNYFLNKVSESLTTQSVKEKAMSAVILNKAGKNASGFMASLKEHLVETDEQGMYFAFNESPYRWNDLRIPAHVAAMEAFDRVNNDSRTVEEMKIWLLKQKQTQQWDSPVSTVDAVYALLHSGSNLLENRGDVRITIGNNVLETLSPSNESIPGISYIKQSFTDKNTLAKPGTVKVEKRDSGIAWGAVYAQYNEEIDKVNRRAGEIGVDKKLYVEKVEGSNKQLVPVTANTRLAIGDKVVSRITITLDRAMDFVQLKDQRGACFEPIGALSGYNWSNGFGYYVAVKDASTNFFFDSLGKGVYVLEYSYRVNRTGTYEGGLAILQSAYAPEFSSHSASVKVEVK